MPVTSRLRAVLLAAAMLTPAGLAHADPTAEQATALEQQIHGWLANLLGPNVPIAAKPVRVTAEGDHFAFAIDVAGKIGDGGPVISGPPATAAAKPLDGGKWDVSSVNLPSPLRVELPEIDANLPRSWGIKIAQQSLKGVFDPSLATPTTLDGELRDYTQITENKDGSTTTHMAHYTGHTLWQPAGDGRVDALSEGHVEGLTSNAALPGGKKATFSIDKISTAASASGLSFAQAGVVIHSALQSLPSVMAQAKAAKQTPGSSPTLSPADRATAHAAMAALRDMTSGMEARYALEGLKMNASGVNVTLAKMTFGSGIGAPGGRLDMHMLMTLDGVASPMIPPGVIASYVPKHFSIAPRIGGIPAADVMALIDHAIDSDGSDEDQGRLQEMAIGLLAKGPLVVGLDDISMDAGPATLKGSLSVKVSSPSTDDMVGEAVFTMTGMDELIHQTNTTPELKQAAPVLIFLKGIGKQIPAGMVWNVSYADNKVMVNDTDLSGMLPAGK